VFFSKRVPHRYSASTRSIAAKSVNATAGWTNDVAIKQSKVVPFFAIRQSVIVVVVIVVVVVVVVIVFVAARLRISLIVIGHLLIPTRVRRYPPRVDKSRFHPVV